MVTSSEIYSFLACKMFKTDKLREFQKDTTRALIRARERDMCLSVKTGDGKSLCYQICHVICKQLEIQHVRCPVSSVCSRLALKANCPGLETRTGCMLLNRYDWRPEPVFYASPHRRASDILAPFRLVYVYSISFCQSGETTVKTPTVDVRT